MPTTSADILRESSAGETLSDQAIREVKALLRPTRGWNAVKRSGLAGPEGPSSCRYWVLWVGSGHSVKEQGDAKLVQCGLHRFQLTTVMGAVPKGQVQTAVAL